MSTPNSNQSQSELPAILCLHGRGSNSTIFRIQARRITAALQNQFRFIFVDAPFPSEAGPGILPVFESISPFYTWVRDNVVIGEGTQRYTIVPPDDKAYFDVPIDKAIAEYGGWDQVVGIMSFSQGARLSMGLVLQQVIALKKGVQCKTKFQFGVFLGAPFPPICVDDDEMMKDGAGYELMKGFPTVHAWGDEDPYKNQSVEWAAKCEGEKSFEFEFAGGHHLPLTDDEAGNLISVITQCWRLGQRDDPRS